MDFTTTVLISYYLAKKGRKEGTDVSFVATILLGLNKNGKESDALKSL